LFLLKVANRQTRILDQTLVQTNKAFICTHSIIHTAFKPRDVVEGWNFHIKMRNTGNTPTLALSLNSTLLIRGKIYENKKEFLQSGMIGPHINYDAPLHFADANAMNSLWGGETDIFLYGYCRYQTVFSKKWEVTEFCFSIIPIDSPIHPGCRFRFPAIEGRNRVYQTSNGDGVCPPSPT